MPANLQKDKEKFFQYTLKWASTIELLLENHLSELLALSKYCGTEQFKDVWGETTFCKDCILSHCKELIGYSSECLTQGCPSQDEWQDLFTTANELHDFLLPLTEMSDYTPEVFDKVAEYNHRLRQIRKKLEEAGVEFATKNKSSMIIDEKEHIEI